MFLLLPVVLCTACLPGSSHSSAKELLERSAAELQQLQSADLSVEVTMKGDAGMDLTNVHLLADGSLQDAGKKIGLKGTMDLTSSSIPLRLTGELFLQNGQEIYIRITDVAANAGLGYMTVNDATLQGFLNRWWLLPTAEPQPTIDQPSDPSLLPLQMRSLDITDDEGTSTMEGEAVRELSVKLNRKRLQEFLDAVASQRGSAQAGEAMLLGSAEATGTVWIAEETSMLKRIRWNLAQKGDTPGTMDIDVVLKNPDAGQPLNSPEGALPLVPGISPVTLFLQNVSDSAPSQ